MKSHIGLKNGAEMPLVGLGTGKIVEEMIERTVEEALRLGYRHFDTATAYSNENGIGNAVQKAFHNGMVSREDLFLTTKLPLVGMHKNRVEEFLDLSLKKLGVSYVDMYLIHWPVGLTFVDHDVLMPRDKDGELLLDMETNLVEIWKVMEELVDKGKALAIGISNFNETQLKRILDNCRIFPETLQVEMHVYFQQKSLCELCTQFGISVVAYAPLGSPGRAQYYINAHNLYLPKLLEDKVVNELSLKHGKSPAQILLKFLTQGLKVAVIPKSIHSHRLSENIKIFDFDLSNEDIERLIKLDQGEQGRSCQSFKGASDHPECPF